MTKKTIKTSAKQPRASTKPEVLKKPRQYRASGLTASGQVPDALKNFDALPPSASVRQPVVEGVLACSAATVWRLVKAGKLNPRKLSERVTGFNVGELRALLASA